MDRAGSPSARPAPHRQQWAEEEEAMQQRLQDLEDLLAGGPHIPRVAHPRHTGNGTQIACWRTAFSKRVPNFRAKPLFNFG